MNIELLLPLIRKMLPKNRLQDFDRGVNTLREYGKTHSIRTAGDAMRALTELNVPGNFLSETGGLARNPVVSSIASMLNVNTDKIQEDVRKLSGSPDSQDPLAKYKDDLNRL